MFCLALVLVPDSAQSTIFVPPSIEHLTGSSSAVILATVADRHSARHRDGSIVTKVQLNVQIALRGPIPPGPFELRETGGVLDDVSESVDGAPRFRRGEPVLLFLSQRADGSWHTNHMSLGKWRIVDRAGISFAVRDFGEGATVVLPVGERYVGDVRLSEIAEQIRPGVALPAEVIGWPEYSLDNLNAFELLNSTRFFELDDGQPLAFLIDERGDSTLGLTDSRAAVQQAMAAWNGVSETRLDVEDGGLTSTLSAACPGNNVVRFDDPGGEIPAPVDCHGVLALGGNCSSTFEKKYFHGAQFSRARRGVLTFADGWGGCAIWTPCNLAEIATHEFGHILGLDHSSESDSESDPKLSDATMFFRAHFDGRCADLRDDDEDGARFLYPTELPPTITNASPLPSAVVGVPFALQLEASGGSGEFEWWVDPSRGGFAGFQLSAGGLLTGLAVSTGKTFFLVRATDTNGDSHTKVLELSILNPLTPLPTSTATPTITRTATITRTSTATITATRTATDSPTPTTTRTATHTPPPSSTATPTATATPSNTPTVTATSSATPSATWSPTVTATPSATTTASATSTPTRSPSSTATPSATASGTPSRTPSSSPSITASATATATTIPTSTLTRTASATPTASVTFTASPSASATTTASPSASASASATHSPSVRPSPSMTASPTASVTAAIATISATATATATRSPSATPSSTAAIGSTATPERSATSSAAATATSIAPSSTPTTVPTTSASPTVTGTYTPSATAVATDTALPTATATEQVEPTACGGDCDGNGNVTVNEILVLVSVALGGAPLDNCAAGDLDHDGRVTVDEILKSVEAALRGCGS